MRGMSNPAATEPAAAASAPLREFVTSSTRRPGDVQCPVLAALFLAGMRARLQEMEARAEARRARDMDGALSGNGRRWVDEALPPMPEPVRPAATSSGTVAQLVEQGILNPTVGGSSPPGPTRAPRQFRRAPTRRGRAGASATLSVSSGFSSWVSPEFPGVPSAAAQGFSYFPTPPLSPPARASPRAA